MRDGFNVQKALMSIAVLVFMGAFTQADAGDTTAPPKPQTTIEARLDAPDPIRGLIEKQLKAFRHGDPAAVYRFASDEARSKYHTAGKFFMMMRDSCNALPFHVSYSFMERSDIGGKALQKIEFLNSDGSTSTGFYRLVKNADGKWAVDGCLMLESNAQPI